MGLLTGIASGKIQPSQLRFYINDFCTWICTRDFSSSYLNVLWLHYFCYEQYLKITGFKIGSSSYFQYASYEGDIFIGVCHLLFANDEKDFEAWKHQCKFNIPFCSSKNEEMSIYWAILPAFCWTVIDNFCLISIEKSCNYSVGLPVKAGLAPALKSERGCPRVTPDIFSEVLLPH